MPQAMNEQLPHESNFAELLRGASNRWGDRTAISSHGRSTSFNELTARAADIADALRTLSVADGDRCAILLRQPDDAIASFFGVLGAGAVAINVNELYRPRQIEQIVEHSDARILITSDEALRALPRQIASDVRILNVGNIPRASSADAFVISTRSACDAAQVTYTSGSTGKPKGVLTSHSNLWAGTRIVARYLGLREDDRIASLLPFSFVYGFNQLTTSLYVGATLIVERSPLPLELVAGLRRERVTVLAAVPPLWQQLLTINAFREKPLDTLRVVTNAGGRLPPATVRLLRETQPQARLYLMYGLTEVFRSAYLDPDEVDAHPDSMGRAIPESTIYVVAENGELAAPGEIGELVHGGPTVAMGYLNDPEATARVFRRNPFAADTAAAPERVVMSGDLVRLDHDGRLYYVGRRDRVFKTLGYRVSPDEICDVLHASGQVTDAEVITESDPQRGERVVACVVLRDGGTVDELRRFCGVELPRYMQPARYEAIPSIPRNASGKHDVMALRESLLGG